MPDTTSDGPSPHIHRADEWLEHDDQALLDALQERRDRLKVEFALGKISAVGYERMRAKIDDEYAAIELRVAERQRY